MKLTGKRLLACGLAAVMTVSAMWVQNKPETVQAENATTTSRQGEAGCLEIPGTESSFDEYNTSFLSVTGFASEGVNDRTADLGTSKHRKVSTPAELLDAIKDAKRGSYIDANGKQITPASHGSVTIIEVMNDLDMGNMVPDSALSSGVNDVQSQQSLNSGYTVTHKSRGFSGVTALNLSDIDGLTIFSNNGSTIEHCTLNIGSGGTNIIGSNDIVIRNLRFDGCWQWDNTGSQKEGGWAYMKIYMSSNVWIDHCTFTLAIDGNVDIESGSNGVTISWCKFGMTGEEAKKEGSVVRNSIEYMEDKYQIAVEAVQEDLDMTLSELIAQYKAVYAEVEAAGYNPNLTSSLNTLKSKNKDLYSRFTETKEYYDSYYAQSKNILINKGTIYANMRLAGATPEQIMEYSAYHSKVHLVGSGDREFRDNDTQDMITIHEDGTYTIDETKTGTPDSNERLELTLAYDCYNNVGQRIPMIRQGVGHLYNCYIDNTEHEKTLTYTGIKDHANEKLARGMNSRNGASIAADTCVYNGFNEPMIGREVQGGDNAGIWRSLYKDAINWAVIVNSKTTNARGETYVGSSWDNGGMNQFTRNGYTFKYSDVSLKKFCWDSQIVSIGDTPISKVSRNILASVSFAADDTTFSNPNITWNGQKIATPSWLTRVKDESGNDVTITYGNETYALFEPFKWEHNYDTPLPYEYQLVELEDVETVIPNNSGAGAIEMIDGSDWLRTTYTKGEEILAEKEEPVVSETPASEEPVVSEVPSGEAVTSETPASEDVVTSETPASEDVVTSETPASEDVVTSEIPASEDVITSSAPSSDKKEEQIKNEDGSVTNKITEIVTKPDGTTITTITETTTKKDGTVVESEKIVAKDEEGLLVSILNQLIKIAEDIYERLNQTDKEQLDGTVIVKKIIETSKVEDGKVVSGCSVVDEKKDVSGVSVEKYEYDTGVLPSDVEWKTSIIEQMDDADKKVIEEKGAKDYVAYDIVPQSKDTKPEVKGGKVKVTLNCGDKWIGKKVKVFDFENSKWLDAVTEGEYVSFYAEHFSKYAIAEVEDTTEVLFGDVNNDSVVDLADAQLTLKAALKIIELKDMELQAADIDKCGVVELSDAQMILKYALKIINTWE